MSETQTMCAACGRKGHRYGRNEGMDRFDPQACINGLRSDNARLRAERTNLRVALREIVREAKDALANAAVDTAPAISTVGCKCDSHRE